MTPLASYQIRKIACCACTGDAGNVSPSLRVSDPDMNHGTCVTHVLWCMLGSLFNGFLWSRWRVKHSRHSRRMCNPQFYVSGKRPIWHNETTLGYHDPRGLTQCSSKIKTKTQWRHQHIIQQMICRLCNARFCIYHFEYVGKINDHLQTWLYDTTKRTTVAELIGQFCMFWHENLMTGSGL